MAHIHYVEEHVKIGLDWGNTKKKKIKFFSSKKRLIS